jgi:hypothetical protein
MAQLQPNRIAIALFARPQEECTYHWAILATRNAGAGTLFHSTNQYNTDWHYEVKELNLFGSHSACAILNIGE